MDLRIARCFYSRVPNNLSAVVVVIYIIVGPVRSSLLYSSTALVVTADHTGPRTAQWHTSDVTLN